MISVKFLFEYVNENLAGHQGAAYDDVDMFNRSLRVAQEILFDYYLRQSASGRDARRLAPFTKTATMSVGEDALIVLPDDYRELRSLAADYYLSGCVAEESRYTVNFKVVTAPEIEYYLTDAILAPSLVNLCTYALYDEGTFRIFPRVAEVRLRYYRNPVLPNLALTYTDSDLEVLDAASTVDLEWPETELDNFATLLAFQKGVSDRESALLQYAQARGVSAQTIL